MEYLIAAVAIAVIAIFLVALKRRGGTAKSAASESAAARSREPQAKVAEFHVVGSDARVHFEVPIGADGADEVLQEILGREAVEVVRDKRHSLPLGEVHRVVALGRGSTGWVEVTTISLDTPGELPPPMRPAVIPHIANRDFNPFDKIAELPQAAPGLASRGGGDALAAMVLKLPAAAQATLRTKNLDPATTDAVTAVLALMGAAGYVLQPSGKDSFLATRSGEKTFVRTVAHGEGEHPELAESEIRSFVVDFGASGAKRGVLITEKYSPFEVYDRERRNPNMRFVTRERLQSFADALVLA